MNVDANNEFQIGQQEIIAFVYQEFEKTSTVLIAAEKELGSFFAFYRHTSEEMWIIQGMNSEERQNDINTLKNIGYDLELTIFIILNICKGFHDVMVNAASRLSDELFYMVRRIVIIFNSVEERWNERFEEIERIYRKFIRIAEMREN